MTHTKKVCIVGTAETWRQTPWADPSIEIWSLNDAYQLGFPRADRWYEQHPFEGMWFRPAHQQVVQKKDVPPGAFIRPEGHLDWLKTQAQTIPVFLQKEPPADWPPNAHRFPIEAIEEVFGSSYWASGPSYILAQAFLEGYTEIWITGIHLATEHEYREQRPQFESLIGRLLGPKVVESVSNGFRVYDGAVRIVLPIDTPILTHAWKYAYEPKPTPPPNPYAEELQRTQKAKAKLVAALVNWPTGQDKSAALADLADIEVVEMDCQQMIARMKPRKPIVAALQVSVGMGG